MKKDFIQSTPFNSIWFSVHDTLAGTTPYKGYMSYKKVNCIRIYNKENEIMYSKLRLKQITQKQFNQYIELEKELRGK